MNSSKLFEIYIKQTNPSTYHIGGMYFREDPIDMAVMDVRMAKESMLDALRSCIDKLAPTGHIFIPSDTYDDCIIDAVNSYQDIVAIAATTDDVDTRVLYKIDKRKQPATKIDKYHPAYLRWVRNECCTLPVTGPVDAVYTISDSPSTNDYEELRLSIRSLARHAINLGNIWIVSKHMPEFLNNAHHIYGEDNYNNCKDANIINKVLAACANPDVSNRFIFMSDDQIFNMDIDLARLSPVFNDRDMKCFDTKESKNRWVKRMLNTFNVVKSRGGSTDVNWDSHVPQPIDKSKFMDIMMTLPYTTLPGLCINTAYFGCKLEPAIINQNNVKDTYENTCKLPINPTKPFIGYNDKGYETGLREVLLDRFNDKCIYEK